MDFLSIVLSVLVFAVIMGAAVAALVLFLRRKNNEDGLTKTSELDAFKYHNGSGIRRGP